MGPAAIMIGRSVFVCFVLVNLSLYGCDAVSAAIMVGRSVFVCFAFVKLSPFGLDAVSAVIMVGRSVFVCLAFVSLSLSGFGVVQVWKRVNPVRRAVTLLRNMAGAGEVKSFTCLCRTSLLSACERFFLDLCASSLVAALFESQWSALPTSAHS